MYPAGRQSVFLNKTRHSFASGWGLNYAACIKLRLVEEAYFTILMEYLYPDAYQGAGYEMDEEVFVPPTKG